MIKTPTIHVLEHSEYSARLRLHLPTELVFFKGHFPQEAILPGVVQIDWAIRYAREFLPIPSGFAGLKQLKFTQVMRPEQEVTLTLNHDAQRQYTQFSYQSEQGSHASGIIVWGANV